MLSNAMPNLNLFTLAPLSRIRQTRTVARGLTIPWRTPYQRFTGWRESAIHGARTAGTLLAWPLAMYDELQGVADAQEAALAGAR